MKQVRRHSMQNGALQGSKVAMTLRFTPIRGKWDHGLVLRWCKTFDWGIDDQNPLTTLKKWSPQHAEHVGHWSRLWSSLITQFIRWRAATTRLHIEATLASSCFILLHLASCCFRPGLEKLFGAPASKVSPPSASQKMTSRSSGCMDLGAHFSSPSEFTWMFGHSDCDVWCMQLHDVFT